MYDNVYGASNTWNIDAHVMNALLFFANLLARYSHGKIIPMIQVHCPSAHRESSNSKITTDNGIEGLALS